MRVAIYWFRNDLRLTDNAALAAACAAADRLLMVRVRPAEHDSLTRWGFVRCGAKRRHFIEQACAGLAQGVKLRGNRLIVLEGQPAPLICALARQTGATHVYCEAIAAAEQRAEIAALREAGLTVTERWQSSLLDVAQLPFAFEQLPRVFTQFRQAVERAGTPVPEPLAAPSRLPPPGPLPELGACGDPSVPPDDVAWFAFGDRAFAGAEVSALAHLQRYFDSGLPRSYKETRNHLTGIDFSTKLSAWLSVGALSARTVLAYLRAHEARFGANESTYWIWFELLWRDFFRLSALKPSAHQSSVDDPHDRARLTHDPDRFAAWCAGRTGQPFVDAGLRELEATGYLSNRMRQVVASYLVHDLGCDWRAGAAWFESRLIDYDVYSNEGNWRYIAGAVATAQPRRRFDPDRQAAIYDPDGSYRARWAADSLGTSP